MFSKKDILSAIEDVAKLLEKGRTVNVEGRDYYNKIVDPRGVHACKWCPLGAIRKVCSNNFLLSSTIMTILSKFIEGSIIAWNDELAASDTEVILTVRMAGIAFKEGLVAV